MATLVSGLWGCASQVSLDEKKPASADADKPKVYYANSAPLKTPDPAAAAAGAKDASDDPGLWTAPVALAYSLDAPATPVAVPILSVINENSDGWDGVPGYGQPEKTSQKSSFEFQQKVDENWVVSQSVRYGQPANQPSFNWIDPARQADNDLYPGLGTFDVGSQAMGKFATVGLHHQVKFGFDYAKSRDIYDNRVGPVTSLDIFDPAYGTSLLTPLMVTRSYSERRSLGLFMQDEVQLNHWVLTLVARRDQISNHTIDLASADGTDPLLQDTETLSGRAGLRYQFDSGLAPYFNYSQTYAPMGGSDLVATANQQYETGIKYQPVQLGKLVTLSAFDQVQNNIQTGDASAGCGFSSCSAWAELRTRGASIESKLVPVQGLNLVASYAVTSSTVGQSSADAYAVMLANRFPNVSQEQASVSADYAVGSGTLAGLSVAGRVGHTNANYGNAVVQGVDASYVLVDAGVNYDFSHLDSSLKGLMLRASANNLLDRGYWTYCYTNTCAVGMGRSVSAMLNYQVRWP